MPAAKTTCAAMNTYQKKSCTAAGMVPLAPAAHNRFFGGIETGYLRLTAHFCPGGHCGHIVLVLGNALTELNKSAKPTSSTVLITVKTPY